MSKQITNTVLMIRPEKFRANEQTMVNNYYQKKDKSLLPESLYKKAQNEFDAFVKKLITNGIDVIVIPDSEDTDTPDSIFPNNWVSFHENKTVAVYPMFAENRRLERREDILETIEKRGFIIDDVIDYTGAEDEEVFLEGTGSIILDRENQKAYCALSPRADEDLFIEFCEDFEYTPVIFTANQTVQGKREAIYHTNVMMCVAETFAVICLDSIDDKKERKNVVKHLKEDKKQIIAISENQVNEFAGNMLQVKGENEKSFLIMSESAYKSLNKNQINQIEKHTTIIYSDLSTIEKNGGGSARCMLAEVFLPKV
ncbi:arginine deiminase-related protein [Polaribacter sp.]|nr:arginine deiminase-related protein [Polaribacter sp.]